MDRGDNERERFIREEKKHKSEINQSSENKLHVIDRKTTHTIFDERQDHETIQ